jgi:S-disulfanyl-L-cysteine oxidoreductase SoxD
MTLPPILRGALLTGLVLTALPACATGQAATTPGSAAAPAAAQAPAQGAVSYAAAQAEAGARAYVANACAACHLPDLSGAEGPPLIGSSFTSNWGSAPVSALFDFVKENMPATAPGSLPDQTYVELVAYLLSRNGVPAGATALTSTESRPFGAR